MKKGFMHRPRDKTIIGMILFSIVAVLGLSVGYSALNTELSISGDAYVRVDKDIRIVGLKMVDATNGAYETYKSRYSVDETDMFVTLPNANSSITYQIDIANRTNNNYLLKDLQSILNTNTNISYEIGINIGDLLPKNQVVSYTIRFTYNGSVAGDSTTTVKLKYLFDIYSPDTTVFAYNYTGGIQSFTAPVGTKYQFEVWGASGGSAKALTDTFQGGYGGYSIGTKYLAKGQTVYLAVGGKGASSEKATVTSAGGYNGGGTGLPNTTTIVNHIYGGGGGATSITTTNRGVLSNYNSYRSEVLIVAGGGGGARDQANHMEAARWGSGGNGGGYKGSYAYSNNQTLSADVAVDAAGTQTTGYAFGQGESNTSNAGGGGGWYGGYGGVGIRNGEFVRAYYFGVGGGGSGYIGGVESANGVERAMYCYNTTFTNSSSENRTYKTTTHHANAVSKSAKSGDGAAKITVLIP